MLDARAARCDQDFGLCEQRVASMAAPSDFWDGSAGRALLIGLDFLAGVGVTAGIVVVVEWGGRRLQDLPTQPRSGRLAAILLTEGRCASRLEFQLYGEEMHMLSQNSKQRFLWVGLAAVLVGALLGLPWVTSAAPKEGPLAASHLVSREHAEELITRFRATAEPTSVRAHSFDRSAFDALLAQPEAEGIRIYYGKYADGTDTVVLYATDENGRDLSAMPANNSRPCPPSCPEEEPSAGTLRRYATTSKQKHPVDSHLVGQEYAEELIARYRATAAPGAARAQSFDRSAFDVLLAQPGAEGIRIYYGKYADRTDAAVLYATDKNGQDLSAMPANMARPCPPYCPEDEPSIGDLP